MSFNIRYGTAKDGENHWTARREMLFDVIREQDADLIGLQEALASQIDEIVAAVPIYAVVGVGRDDAARAGEFSAILFRRDRFRVAEAARSGSPTRPRSRGRSPGATTSRASRRGRGSSTATAAAFYHFNLHLDHESQPSRERSTVLLKQRIDARAAAKEPVDRHRRLQRRRAQPRAARRSSAPDPATRRRRSWTPSACVIPTSRTVGTFTAFKFGATGGEKIDYVLVPPGTEVLAADIVRTSRNERYPSDHFPVVARVRLQ